MKSAGARRGCDMIKGLGAGGEVTLEPCKHKLDLTGQHLVHSNEGEAQNTLLLI